MQAFGEYVVGTVVNEEAQLSKGGLVLPANRTKLKKIKVTSAGKKAEEELGPLVGKTVVIPDYSHPEHDDVLIVNYKEIYASL